MLWVKFHEELRTGNKRDLSRATRFIYLEICMEARRRLTVKEDGAAWIPISGKGTPVQAIRDLIGGNAMEIRHAFEALTAGEDPMLAVVQVEASSGLAQRYLVVRSFVKWNRLDDSSKRVEKHREQKRAVTEPVTRYTSNGNASVTPLDLDQRESKRREEEGGEAAPVGPVVEGMDSVSAPAAIIASAMPAPSSDTSSPTIAKLPAGFDNWIALAQACADRGNAWAKKFIDSHLGGAVTALQRKTLLEIHAEVFEGVPRASGAQSSAMVASKPDNGEADTVFAEWLKGWYERIGNGPAPILAQSDTFSRGLIAARLADGYTVERLVLAAKSIWQDEWRFTERGQGTLRFGYVFKTAANVEKALESARRLPAPPAPLTTKAPIQETKVAPRPVCEPVRLGPGDRLAPRSMFAPEVHDD